MMATRTDLPVILQDADDNTYVYGLDLISRSDDSDGQEYYLYDGLGSTTGLADGAGHQVASYQYDAFGALRRLEPSHANAYDPGLGRLWTWRR